MKRAGLAFLIALLAMLAAPLGGEAQQTGTVYRIGVLDANSFELTMTIAEHEKRKLRCPTCKSMRVAPQLGGFMAQTEEKS